MLQDRFDFISPQSSTIYHGKVLRMGCCHQSITRVGDKQRPNKSVKGALETKLESNTLAEVDYRPFVGAGGHLRYNPASSACF